MTLRGGAPSATDAARTAPPVPPRDRRRRQAGMGQGAGERHRPPPAHRAERLGGETGHGAGRRMADARTDAMLGTVIEP